MARVWNKRIQDFLFQKPSGWDVLGLILFVIFITFQPFYMQHEIIMMETGIHLPAINALFHGLVPYRDFFYLRGPVELYVPALMMKWGGINSALLPTFYYAGTVLTLILAVVLAGELFCSRLILYTMVPFFVARTFPRVSYYYWGGMRYAMGFFVLLFLFYFFKTRRRRWILLSGIMCALASLTTAEAGFAAIVAVMAALVYTGVFQICDRKFLLSSFLTFCLGIALILVPYLTYLVYTGSLKAFIESTYAVVMFMGIAYPSAPGTKPETLLEFLRACVPGNKFFQYTSVLWCYVFFAVFLFYQARQKKLNWVHAFLTGVMFYGLILFAAAFRKIEGHHFEMALQVEKFVYFFLIESAIFYAWTRLSQPNPAGWPQRQWAYFFVVVLFISSLVYPMARFEHRFTMIKFIEREVFHQKKVKGLSLLENQPKAFLNIDRARGHIVPRWQEEEITGVVEFLKTHTKPDEEVFCYPEVGNFNFWADRPFIGRFPIATFTWMYEPWYQELLNDFLKIKPHYVIMTHLGHRTFPRVWYFRNPHNKQRFEQMTQLILANYMPVKSFESVAIYERKKSL